MEDKILKLLGSGISPGVVATTVGCDPSYVSQLLGREDFALKVAEMRCATLEAATTRDNKYDSIEDRLLEKLEDVLPFMMKPRDILDALTKVNAAKRRGAQPLTTVDTSKQVIINLSLPVQIVKNFVQNKQGEVIEVGDRQLINMPAADLMKSLEQRRALDEQSSAPQIKLSSEQSKRSVFTEDSV
jgi:hypothetical protein